MPKRALTGILEALIVLVFSVTGVAAGEPKRGGTVTYTLHPEPTALSTIATTAIPVATIASKIYESLLEYEGPFLNPRAGLAESWTVSPDQRVYTLKLRRGVKWHDGQPFTSADVKVSIERVVKPYHSRGQAYFGHLESVQVPDPQTVVFKLKQPVPFFLKAFQPTEAPILPKHLLDKLDLSDAKNVRQSELMQKPIGTGPFRLQEWRRGSHIILERNPDYWKPGRPFLDRIVLRVIPDGAARAIAFENGEVDVVPMSNVPPAEIARLAGLGHVARSDKGAEGLGPIMWLEVNLRKTPLSDVRVRRAISLALDRTKIANIIWFGQGKPATSPIVTGGPYHDKSLKPFEYDLAKANALLDEAGYRRGPGGVRFKLVQNYQPYGESWVRQAEFIKQELGKIGVEVETQSLDFGAWLKRIFTDWDYDFTANSSHNYADPSIGVQRTFHSGNIKQGASYTNSMGYSNKRVDELFNQAAVETDDGKRQRLFSEIQQILREDLPVIPLMELDWIQLWNKRVHGLISNGISIYTGWDSVWVE
jgi:peptide/nickel transport system substrate-binding protein